MVRAPVQPREGHADDQRHRDGEHHPPPPGAGAAQDQRGDRAVEADRRRGVAGREARRGRQHAVEVGDRRPGPPDHRRGREEDQHLADQHRGDHERGPPPAGDDEGEHRRDDAADDDHLGVAQLGERRGDRVEPRHAVVGQPRDDADVGALERGARADVHEQQADPDHRAEQEDRGDEQLGGRRPRVRGRPLGRVVEVARDLRGEPVDRGRHGQARRGGARRGTPWPSRAASRCRRASRPSTSERKWTPSAIRVSPTTTTSATPTATAMRRRRGGTTGSSTSSDHAHPDGRRRACARWGTTAHRPSPRASSTIGRSRSTSCLSSGLSAPRPAR